MQRIEVTDEQHAFVQRLREELSEQVVGKYGTVRERDAIQFLIDNFDGDLEVEAEVAVGESTADGAKPADDGEAITYEETGPDGIDDASDGDGSNETGEGDGETDEPGADGDGDDGGDDDSPDGDDAGDAEDGAAADDDKLDRMMNLLETHDDKWEESPSADYRYRVTLPDGSTEDVQTKDDVRALLFKNY